MFKAATPLLFVMKYLIKIVKEFRIITKKSISRAKQWKQKDAVYKIGKYEHSNRSYVAQNYVNYVSRELKKISNLTKFISSEGRTIDSTEERFVRCILKLVCYNFKSFSSLFINFCSVYKTSLQTQLYESILKYPLNIHQSQKNKSITL